MALDFSASTHKVDHGSASSLTQTSAAPLSVLALVNPDTIVSNTIVRKNGTNLWSLRFVDDTAENIEMFYVRSGGNLVARCVNSVAVVGAWQWVATAIDPGAGTSAQQLYHAVLGAALTEPSYAVQLDNGTTHDDSGGSLVVGQSGSDSINFDGRIAFIGLWHRKLALAEFEQQRRRLYVPIHPADCKLFQHYGLWWGTGTQRDQSGKGNHGTVTGAASAAHAPVNVLWPGVPGLSVAAAVAGKPWHHYRQLMGA